MSILFYVGLMLLCGLLFGRLAKLVGFPNVTGYLIAGLIIGPYILGIVSSEAVDGINIVSEMALGFIAFSIGSEFKLSYFKEVGIAPVVIAIFEGVFAIVFVAVALLIFGFEPSIALMLGAIASATAPAATIMVIRQYRANGPVTKTLLSVVALDDAVALIAFGFAVASIKSMAAGSDNLLTLILTPFIELGISVLLGAAFALLLLIPLHFFKKESNRMCAIVGIVLATSSLADYFGASSLLTCMMLGAILVNISKDAMSVFKISDMMTPPIFMLFFVVSGAKLDVTIIPSIGAIGVIYVITRVIGKFSGSWLGSVITKVPATVKKYLGWTLIPQAGVAIGLTLVADKVIPEYSGQIRAVILCATLIYELVGPVISKIALTKAGEIEC
ncbi:MAG: cation:proton antiporter [Acetivibrionales bacterium]|jgi:Kef-type K+ transport system membrane component KefB